MDIEMEWVKYETDRRRILFMLGYNRFERDAYSHCDWKQLPVEVQNMLKVHEREENKIAR